MPRNWCLLPWAPPNETSAASLCRGIFNSCFSGSRVLFSKEFPIHKRKSEEGMWWMYSVHPTYSELRPPSRHSLPCSSHKDVLWILPAIAGSWGQQNPVPFLIHGHFPSHHKYCPLSLLKSCKNTESRGKKLGSERFKEGQHHIPEASNKSEEYPWQMSLVRRTQSLCGIRAHSRHYTIVNELIITRNPSGYYDHPHFGVGKLRQGEAQ